MNKKVIIIAVIVIITIAIFFASSASAKSQVIEQSLPDGGGNGTDATRSNAIIKASNNGVIDAIKTAASIGDVVKDIFSSKNVSTVAEIGGGTAGAAAAIDALLAASPSLIVPTTIGETVALGGLQAGATIAESTAAGVAATDAAASAAAAGATATESAAAGVAAGASTLSIIAAVALPVAAVTAVIASAFQDMSKVYGPGYGSTGDIIDAQAASQANNARIAAGNIANHIANLSYGKYGGNVTQQLTADGEAMTATENPKKFIQ